MVSGPDQLAADFEDVQRTLELYPSINVIQVEGQPPDNYEIEYLLKGYVRDVDGTIRQGSQHRIRISLPFGYPHFPPTVKPLTALFHPDIDPDAVRIAAYWQENSSLPDLILHIGEMICGTVYNLEDPFNQEAADWYAEHLDELPLDSVHVADIESDADPLDEEDDTFDLLGLEDDSFALEQPDIDEQLDLIRLRIEQKEMAAASQLLAEIPATTPIPERAEIEHVISAALRESETILNEAERLEDAGSLDEALDTLDRINDIAADAPGLDDIRLRIGQAQILAESFSGEESATENLPSATESIPPATKNKKIKKSGLKPDTTQINTASLPVKSILAGVALLLLAGAGGALYFKDRSALKQADGQWQQARELVTKKQYQEAEEAAHKALLPLDKVIILRSKRNVLQTNITKLLNTPEVQQGLQGKAQYRNQYLPVAVVKKLRQLEKLTGEADALIKSGKIRKAIPAYTTALKFAQKNDLQAEAKNISQIINNLRFEETMASARKAENAKEWENAAATYQRALELSKTLSDADSTGEIKKRLAAATFRHELDQSKATFTDAQWQQTIEMLEEAKKLLDENPGTVSDQERKELDRLLADSYLYQILSLARQAYENQEWDQAIGQYQKSLDLLKTKKSIFAGTHDKSITKIDKTMLMITLTREQNGAATAERKNDLKTAISHYKAIRKLTASSKFKGDADIVAIDKNARQEIRKNGIQLAMDNKIQWLKDNFEKIFSKAYPSSRASKLTHPKVDFIKEEKGKQFFNLSCVEKSQGSSFRLEVKYQYNMANGKWSIYYDQ